MTDPEQREVSEFDGMSAINLLDGFADAVLIEDGTRYCGDNKAHIIALRGRISKYRVAILRRMGNKGGDSDAQ